MQESFGRNASPWRKLLERIKSYTVVAFGLGHVTNYMSDAIVRGKAVSREIFSLR